MRLAKIINWYLKVNSSEKQLLYYIDRPRYVFKSHEEKRGGRTILKADRTPTWLPITLELPTRPLEITQHWINGREAANLTAFSMDLEGHLLEEWTIQGAKVVHNMQKRSRVMDFIILSLIVRIDWARRSK